MLKFPRSRFKDIRSGDMNITLRPWDNCSLIEGKIYPVSQLGLIRIKKIKKLPLDRITDQIAGRAGYGNAENAVLQLRSRNTDLTECYSIEFSYKPKPSRGREARPPRPLPERILDKMDERIKKMDRKAQGVTYSALMKNLSRKNHHKIPRLAEKFQCNFNEIRKKLTRLANQRLVKMDNWKRYSLTPRGKQLVEHQQQKLAEIQK